MSTCGDNQPDASTSRSLDEGLARWDSVWHSVARYSVYFSGWYPTRFKEILDTGLPYTEAKSRAQALNDGLSERGFGSPGYGVELENGTEALAAVRAADIFYSSNRTKPEIAKAA